jgi:hypothetical protein
MIDVPVGRAPAGGRVFSLAYRLEFLRLWDQSVERGAKTRLLRENNLPRATVQRWLNARDRGEWDASMVEAAGKSRWRMDGLDRAELARLREENEALKRKLAQSEAVQEILGKAYELLEGIHESSPPDSVIPPALMSADEYAQWLKRSKLS